MDVAFDLLNGRNPIGKGSKQPVAPHYHPKWSIECEKLADYIFDLRDEQGHLLRNGHHKTVIWGFTFTLRSVKAVTEELLTCTYMPYKYVLTFNFSQDHIELLFNKIRHGSWDNDPSAYSFKLALQRIIIRNSIEPSKTGNCTNFDDDLCESEGCVTSHGKENKNTLKHSQMIHIHWFLKLF